MDTQSGILGNPVIKIKIILDQAEIASRVLKDGIRNE